MLIEIWTDLGCPWCYIGEARLARALADLDAQGDAPQDLSIVRRSFERDPDAPVGGELATRVAEQRFGVEAARGMGSRIAAIAAAEGLPMEMSTQLRYATIDAHRLLHLALDPEEGGGPERQHRLHEILLRGHFTAGTDFSDHSALADAGAEAGLDRDAVLALLAGDRYRDRVRADIDLGRSLGVSAVPFFVVDRRLALAGAAESADLVDLIRRAGVS